MNLVVFDLETTGFNPVYDEIIEIGAVRLQDGAASERFHSLVRPKRSVPQKILDMTGIDEDELELAPFLEDVLPQFLSFIAGYRLAGHNVQFDLGFLRSACDLCGYDLPTSFDALDTLFLARSVLPTWRGFALENLAKWCGSQVASFHRAHTDASVTAEVLSALAEHSLQLPYITLQQLARLAGFVSPAAAEWFNEIADRRFQAYGTNLLDNTANIHQLVFTTSDVPLSRVKDTSDDDAQELSLQIENSSDVENSNDIVELSTELLNHGTPLEETLPGFEVRPGQQQMVSAVAKALIGDEHLVIEAGTGTGKSLAYLIPAALYALEHKTRVVVSTHTIALQDQIRLRDFPTLRRVIAKPLSLAVFKGRTHYVCMRKLQQEVLNTGFGTPSDEIAAHMSLLTWLVTTLTGNREELPMQGKLSEVWPRIQSESETCIGKRCPFFKPCHYFRARGAAYEADVIVTNHSLVFSDLKADHRVLPKYDRLILDEAHHLEEEATRHLGEEVYFHQCLSLFGRLVRDHKKHGVLPDLLARLEGTDSVSARSVPAIEQLLDGVVSLRQIVENMFHTLADLVPAGQSEFRITADAEADPLWQTYLQLADEASSQLADLEKPRSVLENTAELETDMDLSGRLFDAAGFLTELAERIWTLCRAGDLSNDWVNWIEQSRSAENRQIGLHRNPISVARILSDSLFANKNSVTLTSATLSVAGKFDYLLDRLGLSSFVRDGRLVSLSVPSPFEFARQALLCVPNDVPELAKMQNDEAARQLSKSLLTLVETSQGKLLALFTSHALLRATAAAIRVPLEKLGYQLFAQGIDGGRTTLLEAFKEHPNAVLFGAQSFWEGIDLPGQQLTTLAIVRLPFAPPTHPVAQARYERLEQEGLSPFWHASLPEAVVRFRQGFGRLIRTVRDYGVVVVYDKRIVTAKYGRSFIQSLPGVAPYIGPEKAVMGKIQSFLQQRS
ncbi:DEAD/DEAH box helicase family protein [Alicyclobacillus tolerans]|uniref:helicase C-terminal domain-containing protein n=1 Tax=Alicyclobacillus tolerans TaxID=90970 RepID=UPI001F2E1EE5|nr:helicase C-terminal domain-containing protein [Alicyclobacillus tolerans]MCF8563786.1 DEAD/DEAH box helicase family protein [Alicyclobacillus tolerans]